MTLLLSRSDIERVLTPEACIGAVEDAFRRLALGEVPPPGILGMHGGEGSFHVKAAFLARERPYFAAKLNANFPHNAARHGLPTIQGVVILSDANNGTPFAVMDSMSITALRTAAASAVAAKYLAPEECAAALICGCGGQAAAQLRALLEVRRPARIFAYDQDDVKARKFCESMKHEVEITPASLNQSTQSQIIITCTTAKKYFLTRDMVRPGAFIAAVGADNEDKQEIDPRLMAQAAVVTDLTEQACKIGDLHHAIAAGKMTAGEVRAELGEVVSGKKKGRGSADEIVIFDSTGTGLQDVAAAIAVYRRALETGAGTPFVFS